MKIFLKMCIPHKLMLYCMPSLSTSGHIHIISKRTMHPILLKWPIARSGNYFPATAKCRSGHVKCEYFIVCLQQVIVNFSWPKCCTVQVRCPENVPPYCMHITLILEYSNRRVNNQNLNRPTYTGTWTISCPNKVSFAFVNYEWICTKVSNKHWLCIWFLRKIEIEILKYFHK